MKDEYEKRLKVTSKEEQRELMEIVDRLNATLQTKWKSAHDYHENLQAKEQHMKELIRQSEFDADIEIEQMRDFFENQLKTLNDRVQHATINVSDRRRKFHVHRRHSDDE